MLIDLTSLAPGYFDDVVFDVCICGAGPAGLALARRLPARLDVALLEAGGLEYSDASQEIYQGRVTGLDYFPLDACRLRYFGGTSGHWAGWCNRMEARDFAPARHVPNLPRLGWPIAEEDLDPYVRDAADFLEIDFDLPENRVAWAERIEHFRDAGYAFAESALRLGDHYREEIAQSRSIRCFYNANVTDIRLTDDLAQVRDVAVQDYAGQAHGVRARAFVLAAGGIENPRILLCANRQIPAGVGNGHGLVGRFFAEHPKSEIGRFLLEDDSRSSGEFIGDNIVTVETPRLQQLGAPSFKVIAEGYANRNPGFKRRLRDLVCRSEGLTDALDFVRGSDFSCLLDGTLSLSMEQYPNENSCVKLNDSRDRFGNPRVDLHWAISDVETESVREAAMLFAQSFAQAGLGRVRLDDWLLAERLDFPNASRGDVGGYHHMCTTRMSDGPATGVVDADCKVFGTGNLYVAGSSVFTTTSHGNPTFTIVQLALRLADHLDARL